MSGRELLKAVLFRGAYPALYRIGCLRRPRKRRALFIEVRGPRLTEDHGALWRELKRRGFETRAFCTDNTSGRRYLLDYARLALELGGAGFVILNDTCGLLGALNIRQGTKVIQLWHGCGAFKKWGLSTADKGFGESRETQERYPAHRCYSLVSVSAEEVIPHYEEAFGLPGGVVKALGVPRTDRFFRRGAADRARERIRERYPFTEGKRILLYAPTFRGETGRAEMPELPDIRKLREELGGEWVMLIKRHGFVKAPCGIPAGCEDFAADAELGISDLLMGADVCVTDYSSLIFEYSLTGRPMVFYAPDREEYFDQRGFYYPYDESFLPGPAVGTTEELAAAIKAGDSERVGAFRDRFMRACDGRSTERIADWIEEQ